MKVAVIITAFNRREKTLSCLERLFEIPSHQTDFTVFLTDDGSSDGTSEAVRKQFPQVVISQGNGSLFWAGGMNLSWKKARETDDFDGFLWLNDDTILSPHIWKEIADADQYARKTFGKGGIYAGATTDLQGKQLTYGASVNIRKWKSGYRFLTPDGTFQSAQVANGNVTFVSNDVVKQLGCLHHGYIHGGDYDYTYWAYKSGFPVLLMRNYMGKCDYDHETHKEQLLKLTLKQRIQYLYSPTGMQLPNALLFQKRFYPWFTPLTFVSYWTKALLPWIIKE